MAAKIEQEKMTMKKQLTDKTKKLMGIKSPAENIDGFPDENGLYDVNKEELGSVIEDTVKTLTAFKDGGQDEYLKDGLTAIFDSLVSEVTFEPYQNMNELTEAAYAVKAAMNRIQEAIGSLNSLSKKYHLKSYTMKSSVKVPRGFPMGSRWFVGLGAGLDHGRRGTVVNIRDYGNRKLKEDEPGRYRDFNPNDEILLMDDDGVLFTMFPNYLEPDVGQTKR